MRECFDIFRGGRGTNQFFRINRINLNLQHTAARAGNNLRADAVRCGAASDIPLIGIDSTLCRRSKGNTNFLSLRRCVCFIYCHSHISRNCCKQFSGRFASYGVDIHIIFCSGSKPVKGQAIVCLFACSGLPVTARRCGSFCNHRILFIRIDRLNCDAVGVLCDGFGVFIFYPYRHLSRYAMRSAVRRLDADIVSTRLDQHIFSGHGRPLYRSFVLILILVLPCGRCACNLAILRETVGGIRGRR